MPGGGFVGIHLRNGQDWVKACQHVDSSPMLFSAPQCVGYKNENGPLTMSMCLPPKTEIIKYVLLPLLLTFLYLKILKEIWQFEKSQNTF